MESHFLRRCATKLYKKMAISWLEVLCEDRTQEQFVRAWIATLSEKIRPKELRFTIAPRSKGAASRFVLREYSVLVKKLRSKNYIASRGLVVMIDGDNAGLLRRKRELDAILSELNLSLRMPEERISILCPCWCIETWVRVLLGEPLEESLKIERFKANLLKSEVKLAASKFDAYRRGVNCRLDAMRDSDLETKRIGI